MKLILKPSLVNTHPVSGFLIRGDGLHKWFVELQLSNLSHHDVTIYPIPNTTVNSVWGCYVHLLVPHVDLSQGNKQRCLKRSENLIIPEKSKLFPDLVNEEVDRIFSSCKHLFHPEFGLVELEKPVDISDKIIAPSYNNIEIISPQDTVERPSSIHVFQIEPMEPDDILSELSKAGPAKKTITDKPLNFGEKVKLDAYRLLFKPSEESTGETTNAGKQYKEPWLGKLFPSNFGMESKLAQRMMQDLEKLEERNKKAVDKLMDLLDKNLEEALHYALPLDNLPGRGADSPTSFTLDKLWSNFSLLGGQSGSGGSVNLGDDTYLRLNEKYRKGALDLIEKGEYQKAAFVYMKLLKDFYQAAETLEKGKMYKEAAAIYEKHLKNKQKAAECYEMAHMFQKSIALNEELKEFEKVGDLYTRINNRKQAQNYYGLAVDEHLSRKQHIKAAKLTKEKMGQFEKGQEILIDGWKTTRDGYKCLLYYFSEFEDDEPLLTELEEVYTEDFESKDHTSFIQVVKQLYKTRTDIKEELRDMGYEIVSNQVKLNPEIVSELKGFNQKDHEFVKDSIRFKTRRRKR